MQYFLNDYCSCMIYLPGGGVVVTALINVSHRWPVYNAGHVQYGAFPTIWQVPVTQYPAEQSAKKI